MMTCDKLISPEVDAAAEALWKYVVGSYVEVDWAYVTERTRHRFRRLALIALEAAAQR